MKEIKIYVPDDDAELIKEQQKEASARLSLQQVAKLSGHSLRTIQRHITEKLLEYEWYNGKRVVTKENFKKYLKR